MPYRSLSGMVDFRKHPHGLQMRITEQIVRDMHGTTGDIRLPEALQPLCSGTRPHALCHNGVQRINVFRTRRLLRKALVGNQFETPNERKKTLPMAVVVRHDANISISGGVRSAVRGQQPLIAGWPLWGLERAGLQVLVHEKRRVCPTFYT